MRSQLALTLCLFLVAACGSTERNLAGGDGAEAGGAGGSSGGGEDGSEGGAEGGDGGQQSGEGEGEGEVGEGEGEGEDEDDFCERFPDSPRCNGGAAPGGNVCEPNVRQCDGHGRITLCDETGSFLFEELCAQPQVCHPPTVECVDPACNPQSGHCKDRYHREYCNETGSAFLPPSPCPEGTVCEESTDGFNVFCSELVCQPGEVGCEGARTAKVCNDTGTRWDEQGCDDGYACDEESASCEAQICDPLARECRDDRTLLACDERGLSQREVPCTEDKVCLGDRCVLQ